MAPISGATFSGHLSQKMPQITMESIWQALQSLQQEKRDTSRKLEMNICIWDPDEFEEYKRESPTRLNDQSKREGLAIPKILPHEWPKIPQEVQFGSFKNDGEFMTRTLTPKTIRETPSSSREETTPLPPPPLPYSVHLQRKAKVKDHSEEEPMSQRKWREVSQREEKDHPKKAPEEPPRAIKPFPKESNPKVETLQEAVEKTSQGNNQEKPKGTPPSSHQKDTNTGPPNSSNDHSREHKNNSDDEENDQNVKQDENDCKSRQGE